jgi:hypothetical protein
LRSFLKHERIAKTSKSHCEVALVFKTQAYRKDEPSHCKKLRSFLKNERIAKTSTSHRKVALVFKKRVHRKDERIPSRRRAHF